MGAYQLREAGIVVACSLELQLCLRWPLLPEAAPQNRGAGAVQVHWRLLLLCASLCVLQQRRREQDVRRAAAAERFLPLLLCFPTWLTSQRSCDSLASRVAVVLPKGRWRTLSWRMERQSRYVDDTWYLQAGLMVSLAAVGSLPELEPLRQSRSLLHQHCHLRQYRLAVTPPCSLQALITNFKRYLCRLVVFLCASMWIVGATTHADASQRRPDTSMLGESQPM